MQSNSIPSPTPSMPSAAVGGICDAGHRIREKLYQWCGVHLDESKMYLIENRLRRLMQELDVRDYDGLIRAAEQVGGTAVRDRIVDALTTHETLFFRDHSPFNALSQHIIPEILAANSFGKPKLRVWSAACSSGQEPYSIAIKLLESVPDLDQWNLSILATDVSSGTVETAKSGVYQNHELQRGISAAQKERFFEQVGSDWKVTERVRRLVNFQIGNLNSKTLPIGPFDLIFCRNVLIYFIPEDANRILRAVTSRLAPGGRLFVGCSEVLRGVDDFLVTETIGHATCYRRKT